METCIVREKHFIYSSYWTSYKGWKQDVFLELEEVEDGYWTSYKGWKQIGSVEAY